MTTTTTLRPMTQAEFERLRDSMFEDYARETAHVRSLTIEEGRAEATRQFTTLLPDGIASKGHYFWRIIAEPDRRLSSISSASTNSIAATATARRRC